MSTSMQRIKAMASGQLPALTGMASCIALILVFAYIADEVTENSTKAFDTAITHFIRGRNTARPEWFHEAVRDVTALGSFTVLAVFLVSVVSFFALTGRRSAALFMFGAVVGGVTINSVLKLIFSRARPDIVSTAKVFTSSFPSGHAALSAITYLSLAALLARMTTSHILRIYRHLSHCCGGTKSD